MAKACESSHADRKLCSQHEMMAHLPLFLHPNPEHVCVIGGGDGGVLREIMRHPSVKHGKQSTHPTNLL